MQLFRNFNTMDQTSTIQRALFDSIKQKLSPNISLVNEIAEILDLSHDSAYRRIRCDKPLTIEELFKLKSHFGISIDAFGEDKGNNVMFVSSLIEHEQFKISNWIDKISEDLLQISESKNIEIIYAAKDPPLFHYFQFPEITAFKVFFWEKTLFQFPEYEKKIFDLDKINQEIFKKGRKALALTTKIPTIEIWNEFIFRILLSQIRFYWESGLFAKKSHLKNLLDKMEKWLLHIQKEAELGFKFLYGSQPEGIENTFQLYSNEVILNDDTILVKTDHGYAAYLTFNGLSLLKTSNQKFCTELNKYFHGLMKKSNLISLSGAKERNRFFNEQLNEINLFRKRV